MKKFKLIPGMIIEYPLSVYHKIATVTDSYVTYQASLRGTSWSRWRSMSVKSYLNDVNLPLYVVTYDSTILFRRLYEKL